MRIAWFRATPPVAANPLDDTAALIEELRSTHAVDLVLERDAHDFVWREARHPFDLCVYELDDTESHRFEWGYLLNYAGVLLLRSTDARDAPAVSLDASGRLDEYISTFRLDTLDAVASLHVPAMASRSIVVQQKELARGLQERYADARVRFAPMGVRAIARSVPEPRGTARPLVVGAPGTKRLDSVRRAVDRVRMAGVPIDLRTEGSDESIVADSDVIVAVSWPPHDVPLAAALAGMAAGTPVVALEMSATAGWPALDPQTWKPRGQVAGGTPIAVTVEPLDDEHSLVLAFTRLAKDPGLRESLGDAGRAWWLANATPGHAAAAWRGILEEARVLPPPRRPADWPRHLDSDGSELARAVLAEHGMKTDI